jgi:hypothetical protein
MALFIGEGLRPQDLGLRLRVLGDSGELRLERLTGLRALPEP